MAKRLNLYSFIAALLCLGLFLLFGFTRLFHSVERNVIIHPLYIVLFFTISSFFFGVIGFSGMSDWKAFFRSMFTMCLMLSLSILLILIISAGHLLG